MARGYPWPRSGKPRIALQDLPDQRRLARGKIAARKPSDLAQLEALDLPLGGGQVDAEEVDGLVAAGVAALDLAEIGVGARVLGDSELLGEFAAGRRLEGFVAFDEAAGQVAFARPVGVAHEQDLLPGADEALRPAGARVDDHRNGPQADVGDAVREMTDRPRDPHVRCATSTPMRRPPTLMVMRQVPLPSANS